MLRETRQLKEAVQDFFQSKDSTIEVQFFDDEHLSIKANILRGSEAGRIHIRNSFFKKSGSWTSLTDKLARYWDTQFPNPDPVEIIPWDPNGDSQ